MKTYQKGSLSSLLLILVATIIFAGVCVYIQKNDFAMQHVLPLSPSPLQQQTGNEVEQETVCGLEVRSVKPNAKVVFPLTVSGVIDNTHKEGCLNWQMFEGQAGSAQLYFNVDNAGWKKLGERVVVSVDDWMATSTLFSTVLNFNNGGIGLPDNTPLKVIFSEENPSGQGVVDTVELPLIFDAISSSDLSTLQNNKRLTNAQIDAAIIANSAAQGNKIKKISDNVFSFVDGRGSLDINFTAKGDLNNDGFEDVVTQGTWCSASCGSDFLVILNEKGHANYFSVMPDGIESSGYKQYQIKNMVIKNNFLFITANDSIRDIVFRYELTLIHKNSSYFLKRILLQACPTEKITNAMPTIGPRDPETSTYYIYEGANHAVSEFDAQWLKNNCKIKETVAY